MIIAAACPAARSMGLRAGMAVTHAKALVPGLDVRDAEPQADGALLDRLGIFAARCWTPRAAVSGSDGLWLDLSGVAHLFGGEQQMCARILGFCARLGFSARIAVAGTLGAAHALARHSNRPITISASGEEAQAIARLPLAALRVENDVLGTARRLGIESIGELISMPRGPLTRRFGKTLLTRLDQALDRSAESFEPIVPDHPPIASLGLVEPIVTAESIGQVLGDLMVTLVGLLERAGVGVRALTLRCERIDGEDQYLRIGTARSTREGSHLLRLLNMKIETIEPGFGIEAMSLIATRCEPLPAMPIHSDLSGEALAADLPQLIDRLSTRLGAARVFRSSAVESDVPERSVRRVFAMSPWRELPSDKLRPVRMLALPEPIHNVMALLPDQPPRRFTWRGQTHSVRQADGPERIYGEWWKRTGEADAVRDYFMVEDVHGGRFWMFRRGDGVDSRTGDLSWHMHGLFG